MLQQLQLQQQRYDASSLGRLKRCALRAGQNDVATRGQLDDRNHRHCQAPEIVQEGIDVQDVSM